MINDYLQGVSLSKAALEACLNEAGTRPIVQQDLAETYHAVKAVNNGGISLLLKCPALYKTRLDGEIQKQTPALLHGAVFHTLVLEPDLYAVRYSVKHFDGKTKAGKEEKKQAAFNEVELIPLDVFNSAQAMAENVRKQPLIRKMNAMPDRMAETSIYWQEVINNIIVPCKARVDLLATVPGFGLVAVDLKSTQDANPYMLSKSVHDYGYHRQAAWYLRALEAIGQPSSVFVLIACEKDPPYLVTSANIAERAVIKGREECEKALQTYITCVINNDWPCYSREVIEIDLPEYAYK